MTYTELLIHYGEIALKGKNRERFETRLVENIRTALAECPVLEIRRLRGRAFIRFQQGADAQAFIDQVKRVFGIANITPAFRVPATMDAIEQAALTIAEHSTFQTFAMRARRSEKTVSFTSQDIHQQVGAAVARASGAKVNLTAPDLTIGVEVMHREAFVHARKYRGVGGLPVGISGNIACLLSGGIDSPVAVWRMMKRGCLPLFIHFHSAPFTSAASQYKVQEIVSQLMQGQPPSTLFIVPFGPVQQKIVTTVPAKYRIILYRRFMIRIACAIAQKHRIPALATGEALSQVASQTLTNLATINAVSTLPILRPLIGYDKQEIVDEAHRIGTYEMSIQPHDDCCSFLMPSNPITRSTDVELSRVEKDLDIDELVNEAIEACQEYVLNATASPKRAHRKA